MALRDKARWAFMWRLFHRRGRATTEKAYRPHAYKPSFPSWWDTRDGVCLSVWFFTVFLYFVLWIHLPWSWYIALLKALLILKMFCLDSFIDLRVTLIKMSCGWVTPSHLRVRQHCYLCQHLIPAHISKAHWDKLCFPPGKSLRELVLRTFFAPDQLD